MDYWQKQTKETPLFPDLLWSRPESRQARGKLAIIGGNSFGFAAVAEAYQAATQAGIGTARVLLPEAVRKVVGTMLEADFAPSTPSGSFSQRALVELLEVVEWADAVLIAGDLGRNSETAVLLEKFVVKYRGPLIITKDGVDYFTNNPKLITDRPDTTIVLSLAQMQKLATHAKFSIPITFSMDLLRLVEALHNFTAAHKLEIVVKHLDNIIVAAGGQISTTHLEVEEDIWRVKTAAKAAVWRIQNPSKPFNALTTAIIN